MRSILEPFTIGDLTLPNRVIMGPMTRARAGANDEPTDHVVEYYAQRASAGLLITEGVYPELVGKGYFSTPGIENELQTHAWKRVTDAVHERGGRIFLQLMHCGRVAHPLNNPNVPGSVSSSAVQPDAQIFTRELGMQRMGMPRALESQEVIQTLDGFERAARNAKAAGFDGIELHAASGYLPNQFLASNTNQRSDDYGGTAQKRCRFVLEAMERLIKVFGSQRTAIKLAPGIVYNDIHDNAVEFTYSVLLNELNKLNLAYLSFQTSLSYVNLLKQVNIDGPENVVDIASVFPYQFMRERFDGPLMASGDLTFDLANGALAKDMADLFVFGRSYISNPDLVERFAAGAPLTVPSQEHFYGGDETGYTTYPCWNGMEKS